MSQGFSTAFLFNRCGQKGKKNNDFACTKLKRRMPYSAHYWHHQVSVPNVPLSATVLSYYVEGNVGGQGFGLGWRNLAEQDDRPPWCGVWADK